LEDILNGSVKGNQRNLDIGPHPVYIESGPPSKDKVRCRIKSIQPLGFTYWQENGIIITSGFLKRISIDPPVVVRRRISLHAPAKGLVLPEKGTRRIMVFTRLLQNSSCLESGSPRPWARMTRAKVTSPMGEDDPHRGHLAHGRGPTSCPETVHPRLSSQRKSQPRSPRPWARTTRAEVTSPMGEDDPRRGHLAHGRGRPAPRSPRPWARTTRAEVTTPMGEDDPRRGHLAHMRGRPSQRSPLPWARTTRAEVISPMGEDRPPVPKPGTDHPRRIPIDTSDLCQPSNDESSTKERRSNTHCSTSVRPSPDKVMHPESD
ncbi:hypothetical protein HID58_055413, partial [Brassica napus]